MQQLLKDFETITWRKEHKFYKVMLQCTLFGEISVVCCWGRIGGHQGGQKIITCNTPGEVKSTINGIIKRRKYRGYILSKTLS